MSTYRLARVARKTRARPRRFARSLERRRASSGVLIQRNTCVAPFQKQMGHHSPSGHLDSCRRIVGSLESIEWHGPGLAVSPDHWNDGGRPLAFLSKRKVRGPIPETNGTSLVFRVPRLVSTYRKLARVARVTLARPRRVARSPERRRVPSSVIVQTKTCVAPFQKQMGYHLPSGHLDSSRRIVGSLKSLD